MTDESGPSSDRQPLSPSQIKQRTSELGEELRAFRPKMSNIIAGAIIGLLLVVGCATLAIWMAFYRRLGRKESLLLIRCMSAVIGIGGPLGGIAILAWIRRLLTHRVVVYDRGFTYRYGKQTDVCPWSDVKVIKEVFTQEEMRVLKIPGGSIKKTDRSFVVVLDDDKAFSFDVNSIDSIPDFGVLLDEASQKFNVAWEQIEH